MKILDELKLSGVGVERRQEPSPAITVEPLPDTAFKTEVDRVTESEWSQLLERFADANIYQTWAYGVGRWGEGSLSHLVLKRGGEVQGVAQLRIFRPPGLKAGIAYLRWGPLCHQLGRELDGGTVVALAGALRQEYVENRGLYLELLPNAFSGSVRAQVFESAFRQYDHGAGISEERYRTVALDLSSRLEDLRKNLDKKWRNQLNAAERNSLTIIESYSLRRFRELYRQMLERKQFHTNISLEEFEQIQERLPQTQKMRILICEYQGQATAGLACSAIGESALCLLAATNDHGMKLKSSYLLQWAMIQRLKQSGIRFYDLGGIDPEANPGVHHFKSGISGADLCHIPPFTACDSKLSRAAVKTGQMLRNSWRHLQESFSHA